MKTPPRMSKSLLIGIVVGMLLVYALASSVAGYRTQSAIDKLDLVLQADEAKIKELVVAIHANTLISSDYALQPNCSETERTEFEVKLSKLEEGLSRMELEALSQLFSRCATVDVDQRSLSTSLLEVRINSYQSLTEAYEALTVSKEVSNVDKYNELLVAEKKVNQKLYELVDLQAEIINELKSGLSLKSQKADELRQKGGVIQAEIKQQTEIIGLLRKELTIE